MTNHALLFDLDDTLYPERSYVESGFRAVAAHVARNSGGDREDYLRFMLKSLDANGRGRIFNDLIGRYALPAENLPITDLVRRYRQHKPAIQLYPGVADMLRRLRQNYRLAIVTDGLAVMQQRKIAALGLINMVDTVVYCWAVDAPKPDSGGYRTALQKLRVEPANALVIGDRPDHDLTAAIALGCQAIRVKSSQFAHLTTPEQPGIIAECETVTDVESLLE